MNRSIRNRRFVFSMAVLALSSRALRTRRSFPRRVLRAARRQNPGIYAAVSLEVLM